MTHFTWHTDPNETLSDYATTFPVFPAAPLPPVTSQRVGFELVAPLTPRTLTVVATLYDALVEDRLTDFVPGTPEHRLLAFTDVLRLYFGRRYDTRLVLHLDIHVKPHDATTVYAFAQWFHDFAAHLNDPDIRVVGTYKG